jgi:NAD(P)H-flavin reductase
MVTPAAGRAATRRPVPAPAAADGAPPAAFLARTDLGRLLEALQADGRTVIGPSIADGAIAYGEIQTIDDLPIGWRDAQAPGRYSLSEAGDERIFDYTVGPTSWKRFTFPPRIPLSRAQRDGRRVAYASVEPETKPLAFLGVRACELAALGVQDRVLQDGPAVDRDYEARRASALVIAVECAVAGATCFCTSMGTGPRVRAGSGFDLALSEVGDGFLVRVGSPAGSDLLERMPTRRATADEVMTAKAQVRAVAERIGDPVPTIGLRDRLLDRWDSPHWARIAERCLSCANCTLVCPTCFCTSVEQVSDLDGLVSTSERTWDSCFTVGFGKVAGGNFRSRPQDRYRQWLTHKFATWIDQFGSFGCVGCGRCITWCPVGIDVRAELAAIAPAVPEVAGTHAPEPVAASPDAYVTARIGSIHQETADVSTLRLVDVDPAFVAGRPGQFAMVARPAFPPAPVSISRYRPDGIDLTIRAAGAATASLVGLGPGDELGLRGPLGVPWPVERAVGRDVIVVTGGIGLAPLRPLIHGLLADRLRFGRIRIFYGARTPADLLYRDELAAWAARADLEVGITVDRAGPDWTGRVGIVTQLFDEATWDGASAIAFVCGPERMMSATAETLGERGLTSDRIFLTFERHMECGIGLCGHCQMGRLFVCRDGPVFSLAEVRDVLGREGI